LAFSFSLRARQEFLLDVQVPLDIPSYLEAFEAFKSLPGTDKKFAKLQNLFALHIVDPAVMKEFKDGEKTSLEDKARVASSEKGPISREFLLAIPTMKGLSLPSPMMRIAIPIEMKEESCRCKHTNDPFPLTTAHALSCKLFGGLIWRHEALKTVLEELCKCARISYEKEPHQALFGSRLRPDMLLRFARNKQDVAFDVTIHNPLRDRYSIKKVIQDDQDFLRQAEQDKRNKYQEECKETAYSFYRLFSMPLEVFWTKPIARVLLG